MGRSTCEYGECMGLCELLSSAVMSPLIHPEKKINKR